MDAEAKRAVLVLTLNLRDEGNEAKRVFHPSLPEVRAEPNPEPRFLLPTAPRPAPAGTPTPPLLPHFRIPLRPPGSTSGPRYRKLRPGAVERQPWVPSGAESSGAWLWSCREMLLKPHSRVQVFEGAEDNLPDRDALRAAVAIRQLAEGLTADDLLLVLISGGGSALLPAPIPPVTLEEKQTLTKLLAARGANIQELNTIRKALSQLKGGGLAQAAYPAQVVSLILSDVVGDPVEVIASGPTVASVHSVQDCLHILNHYGLRAALPRSVKTVLAQSDSDPHGPHSCGHVLNVIIGSNALALAEAQRQAEALGYRAVVLSAAIQGDVKSVARFYGLLTRVAGAHLTLPVTGASVEEEAQLWELAAELQLPDLQLKEALEAVAGAGGPVCLLAGGEPTVQLQGSGKGGRNQELALRVGAELGQQPLGPLEVLFLSGGTDGQDGPTEAAGAWVVPELTSQAATEGLDVAAFLSRNDSHTFFRCFRGGAHLLHTGLTGTNVMDAHLLFLRPR
ncbi:glycerate kinase isoform X7 [Mustela erminea]|uniref:glycerate kinase isoform X7 n=1 Tax=Mustela erminea TaxID=36723 RepID=UPI0013872DA1|nr:glycerate kinase isoform X7 [Mustela erminea]